MKPFWAAPLTMWTIVALGAASFFAGFDADKLFLGGSCARILFAASLAYWVLCMVRALSVNESAPRSVAGVRALVKRGIYARVRHPLYGADIVLAWWIALFIPSLPSLLSAAWASVVFVLWARIEDDFLSRRFRIAHAAYRKNTPMFVPKLFRKREPAVRRKSAPRTRAPSDEAPSA